MSQFSISAATVFEPLVPAETPILATGAEPRRLTVPGAELEGVYYLRTLADCDALRRRLQPGARVLNLVGAMHKAYYDAYLNMIHDVQLVDAEEVLK